MTLDEAGSALGFDRATVHRWERGSEPRRVPKEKIAELYGVRVAWLMYGEEPMRGPEAQPKRDVAQLRVAEPPSHLAVGEIDRVLTRAQASDVERDAAWSRVRSITPKDGASVDWLRGWLDGYRSHRRETTGMIRPIRRKS